MKLRLPNKLIAALMSAMSAAVFTTLATGTTAYGSTTYDDLTKSDYFEANANVYNTGKGTFYLETNTSELNLTLTLNLNALAAYQGVHDYANAGYYGSFVTWTYNTMRVLPTAWRMCRAATAARTTAASRACGTAALGPRPTR